MKLLRKNIKFILGTIVVVCFGVYAKADNLYYYIETLPKSISERDYSKFTSEDCLLKYVNECKTRLSKLGKPSEADIEEYIDIIVELHDIIDQFPEVFPSENGWDARTYTIKGLQSLERLYGIDSKQYAAFFSDYLLYDCKDKLTNKLAYIIANDAFSCDSTYIENVRYKLNRHSNFFDAAVSTIFNSKNATDKIALSSPLYKEMLWLQLILNRKTLPVKQLYGYIYANYSNLDNPTLFKESISLQQTFMDGTGLMLSLFSEDLEEGDKHECLSDIQTWVEIVEKSVVKLSDNVAIKKSANAIHVLAYLQAWKKFINTRGGSDVQQNKIDTIANEVFGNIKIVPNSYQDAMRLYISGDNRFLSDELSEYPDDNDTFIEFLFSLNDQVKSNEVFSQLESLLPPIIEWRLKELYEEKRFLSLLDYSMLCLEYIENHFDNSFMWYVNYDNDETIAASHERKDRLLSEGWTGKSGDKYIASSRVLDFAIDYMIKSAGYNNSSSPILLYEAAKKKLELGDNNHALLYSKMADELFGLLDIHPVQWVDNQRIMAISNNLVYNDSSLIRPLQRFIIPLETKIANANDETQYTRLRDCLLSLYNLLSSVELNSEDFICAKQWNDKALDFIYYRKGSKWAPEEGHSIIWPSGRPFVIPVHFQEWKLAKQTENKTTQDSIVSKLLQVISECNMIDTNTFEFSEITFDVEHADNQKWVSRNEENAIEYAIDRSKDIRDVLIRYCPLMHPKLRNRYYSLSQTAIPEYNGIMAKSDLNEAAECIYNNLLAFHGLQLLTERLIANALAVDDECKHLMEKSEVYEGIDKEELVTIFRSDNYKQKLEERALASQGLKELLSIKYSDIQNKISDNSVVIEFFKAPYWNDFNYKEDEINNEYGYYAIILKSVGTPKVIPLCLSESLPLSDGHGFLPKELDTIATLIWDPILPELKHIDTIYFTPDADLHNMPLEYLSIGTDSIISDIYNIFRLSSSRELVNNSGSKSIESVSLFGNMQYGNKFDEIESEDTSFSIEESLAVGNNDLSLLRDIRGTVEALPNTLKEIHAIGSIVMNNHIVCSLISGNDATETSFKAMSGNAPTIVHIATHGKYWPKIEILDDEKLIQASFLKNIFGDYNFEDALSRSVLLFSGANYALHGQQVESENDGVLTAREISSLDLSNIDLLVLSACQTALGDLHEDGVFGLQRGFKKAGVNTILMSLWEVDDEATKELMICFYENLLKGSSKIEALKEAQKKIRETPGYEDPEYWAGFILLDALN